jgi:hypothetical protein
MNESNFWLEYNKQFWQSMMQFPAPSNLVDDHRVDTAPVTNKVTSYPVPSFKMRDQFKEDYLKNLNQLADGYSIQMQSLMDTYLDSLSGLGIWASSLTHLAQRVMAIKGVV